MTLNKILIALGTLIIAFVIGFFSGKSEKIITEDKIIYKDRIKTITKIVKPDGTVITEEKTEDKQGSQTKTAEKPLSRYSAGIITQSRYDRYNINYGATIGMRLVDNFWIKGSFVPADKQLAVIIEFQF